MRGLLLILITGGVIAVLPLTTQALVIRKVAWAPPGLNMAEEQEDKMPDDQPEEMNDGEEDGEMDPTVLDPGLLNRWASSCGRAPRYTVVSETSPVDFTMQVRGPTGDEDALILTRSRLLGSTTR